MENLFQRQNAFCLVYERDNVKWLWLQRGSCFSLFYIVHIFSHLNTIFSLIIKSNSWLLLRRVIHLLPWYRCYLIHHIVLFSSYLKQGFSVLQYNKHRNCHQVTWVRPLAPHICRFMTLGASLTFYETLYSSVKWSIIITPMHTLTGYTHTHTHLRKHGWTLVSPSRVLNE